MTRLEWWVAFRAQMIITSTAGSGMPWQIMAANKLCWFALACVSYYFWRKS